ncbi:MAG: AsnC family transcriptional regulator [Thermoprotei archaeon]|nr:MAG: AsnC family transcriptional regulator [Thermofilum sp. ex4484_79]RLE60896.1 MAG: AsnC family transcriptional regulator [Thermoprotei archaeon]HDD64391.1 Lrp/AsnC family transcriptional regulator [Thermoprotei archaeon]
MKLLKILQENAKTSYSKISKMLGVSEATVHLRIKKLKDMGIIKKFQAIIDPEKVGKGVMAIIAITAEPKKFDKVLASLAKIDDIYEIYDVTGEYYAILKVRVRSREELARVLDTIGNIDGILSTKTMYVLRVIKEDTVIKI